jgi:Ni/Fe-hydrogenase subunit HybB-like protein
VPVLLMVPAKNRRSPQKLFIAASVLAVAGLLYRLGAYLIAYETGAGWHYFPSLGEIAVTVGLICFEILAITVAIRMLPVLPKALPKDPALPKDLPASKAA